MYQVKLLHFFAYVRSEVGIIGYQGKTVWVFNALAMPVSFSWGNRPMVELIMGIALIPSRT
jgi:hypothetical protein